MERERKRGRVFENNICGRPAPKEEFFLLIPTRVAEGLAAAAASCFHNTGTEGLLLCLLDEKWCLTEFSQKKKHILHGKCIAAFDFFFFYLI